MLGMLTFLIVACNNGDRQQQDDSRASSATHCQSLQHDRGKTKVCGQPQKIVALGPNMLEMLLALDVRAVGYADYFPLPFSKFDRPSQQIPFLGERVTNQPINIGSADDPSLETIARLQPDLILGDVYSNQDEYDLLSKLHPRYYLPMLLTMHGRSKFARSPRLSENSSKQNESLPNTQKESLRTIAILFLFLSDRLEIASASSQE